MINEQKAGSPVGIIAKLAAGVALVAFVGIPVVFGSWYTVDQGERGVILRNGAIVGIAQPGLGFKMPWFDTVRRVSVQQHTVAYDGVQAYSKDQQTATLRLSVTYAVPADLVSEVYSEYGSLDSLQNRVVDRQVNEQVEIIFGKFNAITAVQDRARLSAEVSSAIKKAVVGPIAITSVQVENIDFSDAYEKSIEQRMQAEVEVQKLRQNAEREKVQAEITVTQAQAQADSQRAIADANAYTTQKAAEADAKAIEIKGEAAAKAIKARGDALKENPSLIDLTQAERWDGKLPSTMLPGGGVPMLNIGK
jgi:regulator of protease activity HflC (stomatin/prohibitin superfamily)